MTQVINQEIASEIAALEAATAAAKAEKLVIVESQIDELREQMADLAGQRKQCLIRVSNSERNLICDVERAITVGESAAKAASKLRQNRAFTDEDTDQLNAARTAHRIEINTDTVKAEAAAKVRLSYLHSFRLTHRKDGRVGLSIRGVI